MASLANARTRLGLFGYATRPTGSFLRLVVPSIGPTPGFVDAEDAVHTLLASANALVTRLVVSDAIVTTIIANDDA